jgi:hypothetical protein
MIQNLYSTISFQNTETITNIVQVFDLSFKYSLLPIFTTVYNIDGNLLNSNAWSASYKLYNIINLRITQIEYP